MAKQTTKTKQKEKDKKKEPVTFKVRAGRTLTGKRAGEIVINPALKVLDRRGMVIKESTTCVVGWGRLNPPTIGHDKLVETIVETAKDLSGIPILFLSNTVGKNNPLTLSERLELVNEAYGDEIFIADTNINNPFNLLKSVNESFTDLVWVCGQDRMKDYTRITEQYNGKEFNFESTKVVSAGDRNLLSSIVVESTSATGLRESVERNEFEPFKLRVSRKLQHKAQELFEQLQTKLNIDKVDNPLLKHICEQRYTK